MCLFISRWHLLAQLWCNAMKYTNTKPFVIVFGSEIVPPLSEVELSAADTQHHAIKAMIDDGTLKAVEQEAEEVKPRKTKEAE